MIYKFERKLKGANQVEATGEELTINNAGRKVQKFELSGRSEQKARSGYNLANLDADSFVKSGVTVTNNGDGSWTFNGTSSSADDLVLTKNFLLSNKIYQFEDAKYLFKTIVVSGSFSNPDKAVVRTMGMGQDDGVDNFLILNNELRDGEFSKIFNKKSTSHLSRFELYCGPNVTFNNYTIKILFAKTDNNELEWEQYGVSPSPDFPSEIKNVGKSYNLAYPNWAEEFVNIVKDQSKAKIKEENGITFLNYLASVGYQHYDEIHFFPQIEYKENTTYSFEFDLRAEVKNVENICIEYTDGSLERLGMTNGANIWTHFRFSSNPNKTVKYLRTQYSDGRTDINVNTIQIIESPLFKPYNPYNQKQINIEINNDNSFDIDKIHRGYYDQSRYLKGLLSNYSCGQLFEIKHDTIIRIKNTSDSSWRVYCFVYDENMNKVESIWWGDTFKSGIESSKKIDYKNNMKYVSFSIMDITGIYNPEIFRQSAEVGIYDGRIYSLDNLPKYQEHKGMEIVFPLEEGQKLYEGSYLAKDGIHHKRKQVILNAKTSENWYLGKTSNDTWKTDVFCLQLSNVSKINFLVTILSNYFKNKLVWSIDNEGICLQSSNETLMVRLNKDRLEIPSSVDSFKTWLSTHNIIVEYELAQEEIIPYTPEQQEIYSQLQNLELFRGCNHITVESNVKPAIKLSYYDGELDMTDYKYNLQFKKHMQEM